MRPMWEVISSLPALEPLLESTLRSTVLIGIAALVTLALRRAPAAMRHLVWTLALLGCVAMPVASQLVPSWSLPMPAWEQPETARHATASVGLPADDAGEAASVPPAPLRGDRAAGPGVQATPASAPAPAWRLDRDDVLRLLPVLWLCGVILIFGRHLLVVRTLSRVLRRAVPMSDARWERALARQGAALRIARLPAVRTSTEITVPIVCGVLRPTIMVPVEALEWTVERRDAVLLHELAHVRRFDLLTARVTQLASMLYWFNPFVWLAARSQRAEAERACDDQVLEAGGRASAYASNLLEIARAIGERDRLDSAALAMARRSQLEGRLLAILDPQQPRRAAGRLAISLTALVEAASIGLIAAARPAQSRLATEDTTENATHAVDPNLETRALETPASGPTPDAAIAGAPASTEPAIPSPEPTREAAVNTAVGLLAEGLLADGSSSWNIVDDGKGEVHTGRWNHKDSRGSFKSKGTIRYNRGLDDIVSISAGGSIEIEDRRNGRLHEATFRGRSGGIERSYLVNGSERPWDDDARAWFAQFIIQLDRGSGMFIEQRFPRLMSEGGAGGVLREISLMTSDYGRSIYFHKLLEGDLDEETMRSAVSQAGREISSDYELARTLTAAAKRHALDGAATRVAYLEAVGSLESDYEHARVLMVLVERRDLTAALVDGAVASASQMESDYEQARVMVALAEHRHVKPPQQRGYIRAAHDFDSDYERSRVLRALLEHGRLADENIGTMLLACSTFESDYERANVLVQLAESVPMVEGDRAAFLQTTKAFGSDYDRKRLGFGPDSFPEAARPEVQLPPRRLAVHVLGLGEPHHLLGPHRAREAEPAEQAHRTVRDADRERDDPHRATHRPRRLLDQLAQGQCLGSAHVVLASDRPVALERDQDRVDQVVDMHRLLENGPSARHHHHRTPCQPAQQTRHVPIVQGAVDHRGPQDGVGDPRSAQRLFPDPLGLGTRAGKLRKDPRRAHEHSTADPRRLEDRDQARDLREPRQVHQRRVTGERVAQRLGPVQIGVAHVGAQRGESARVAPGTDDPGHAMAPSRERRQESRSDVAERPGDRDRRRPGSRRPGGRIAHAAAFAVRRPSSSR